MLRDEGRWASLPPHETQLLLELQSSYDKPNNFHHEDAVLYNDSS